MEDLVGKTVVDAKGKSFALADIIKPDTKAVGLYFSAHWCGPCRSFTPQLAKFYTSSLKQKGLEVIFVSSDKDEKAFAGYLGEMPWYALPYSDRDRKNKLSSKFKVQGIPTLVILSPTGELITTEGRGAVMTDPEGNNLPWKPKPVLEILQEGKYIKHDGTPVGSFADLAKDRDAIGLYFSASWCPPCHRFTPILTECYKALATKGKKFEVIFISSDRDEPSFTKYLHEMPWHALAFGQEVKDVLQDRFNVEGIPTLIILDPKTGALINDETVGAVSKDPTGEAFPWYPKSVELLDPSTAGKIGPSPTLFVFCDSDEKAKQMQSDLAVAVDVWQGKTQEGQVCHGDVCMPVGSKLEGTSDFLFYVCGKNDIVNRVKELAKADGVAVAILDLSGPTYAHSDIASVEKATPLAIRKFLQSYLAGTVTKQKVEA